MSPRGSLALMSPFRKSLVLFVAALFVFSLALFASSAAPRGALAADAPVVTLEEGVNGCNGVLPNSGSENHDKQLVGGSLIPGGSATFEISYPVTADEASGRATFVITDCVFIGGEAVLKYSVSFVPNTEHFILTFSLVIPAGTPIGAEYCNYAKTTAAPSESPASNRKAGPACFIVGGNISVLKTNEAGHPLAGATFHVACTIPTVAAGTFLPDSVIDGVSHDSASGAVVTQDVTTDATGRIVIQAPVGTSCVITETKAPDGYDLAVSPSVTLVATPDGVEHTFVDPVAFVPAPGFSVLKSVSLSAAGPWVDELAVQTGTKVFYRITITNTGNVDLTGVTLSDDKTLDLVAAGCTIPTTLAVGAHYDCDYSTTAVTGTTVNTATGDTAETAPDDDTATVVATPTPGFSVLKSVSLSAAGPWVDELAVQTGTKVFYRITITNTGNVDLTGVTLSDDKTLDLVAAGCTIPTTLAVGAHYDCDYSTTAVTGTTVNTATGDTAETAPDDDTATVVATPAPPAPSLRIDKTNNAPLVDLGGTNVPTAEEGDTVTFTLTYASNNQAAANGVITDVLPAGLTYVTGSATSNSEFTFVGYDAGSRTLTWTADAVTASGSVSYRATVDSGASELAQPLENLATIDSDATEPDRGVSDVFVAVAPLGETSVPTAPRTDTLASSGTSAPGVNMGLVLLILVGLAFAIVFVTPVPASMRAKIRRR